MYRQKYITEHCTIIYRELESDGIHLDSILVHKDFRNMGIGSKTLKKFLEEVCEGKFVLGDVMYEKPLNFYRKLGFTIYDTVDGFWSIEYDSKSNLVKDLIV